MTGPMEDIVLPFVTAIGILLNHCLDLSRGHVEHQGYGPQQPRGQIAQVIK